ncbi:MAG: hypothetical protein AAFY77_08640 [Pseudomonadota bacterium]
MSDPREPVFLERETYRVRRLMDAARFLPFLATFLFVIPLVFGPESGTAVSTIYLFVGWFALILIAFGISRRLARGIDEDAVSEGEES